MTQAGNPPRGSKGKRKFVKRLSAEVLQDIELKNTARTSNGLPPIKIEVKACTACGGLFESTGQQRCGCSRVGVVYSQIKTCLKCARYFSVKEKSCPHCSGEGA